MRVYYEKKGHRKKKPETTDRMEKEWEKKKTQVGKEKNVETERCVDIKRSQQ